MADSEGRPRDRRRRRSRSRAESYDYDQQRSHQPPSDARRRDDGDRDRRKRQRSRSRDRPRKARSLSPKKYNERGSERERTGRRPRNDEDFGKDYGKRISRRQRSRSGSRSTSQRKRESPEPFKRSKGPLPSQQDAFQGEDTTSVKPDGPEKQKPNFGTTGRLAAASNTVQASGGQTIVLKYHEPSESRKPSAKDRWRMYVFKDDEIVDTVELVEQSCWLFGREASVVDFMIEHPSCSKQHAVIQFRYMEKRNEFGDKTGRVRPYIIDLESANGTTVNEERIPDGRYVELRDKDVVNFGHSSREYVMQLPPAG